MFRLYACSIVRLFVLLVYLFVSFLTLICYYFWGLILFASSTPQTLRVCLSVWDIPEFFSGYSYALVISYLKH